MKKTILALLLAGTLTLGTAALAACNGSEDPPETTHTQHVDADSDGKCDECGEAMQPETPEPEELALTDGIYICDPIDMGSGRGNAYNYIRFHEDGIFYYAQMANSSTPGGGLGQEAGYYEVVEEELTFEDKTDESQTVERTAGSYIVLTNFDGTPCNIRAVNSGATMTNQIPLYEDALYGIWYDNMIYRHDGDPDFTPDQETLVAVAEFIDPSNSFNTISIGHNGSFDNNISFDEGEWSYNETTRTYTLTGAYGTATLVVSEDGYSATYTSGDTVKELASPSALEVVDEFTGSFTVSGFFPGETTATFYANGRVAFATSIDMSGAGMGVVEDSEDGTWTETDGVYTIVTEKGTITSTEKEGVLGFTYSFDMAGSTGISTYIVEMTQAIETTFTGAFTVSDFFPGTTTATFYFGGRVVFNTSIDMSGAGMGVIPYNETGSWTEADGVYTIVTEKGTITTSGAAGSMTFTYSFDMAGSTGTSTYTVEMTEQVASAEE